MAIRVEHHVVLGVGFESWSATAQDGAARFASKQKLVTESYTPKSTLKYEGVGILSPTARFPINLFLGKTVPRDQSFGTQNYRVLRTSRYGPETPLYLLPSLHDSIHLMERHNELINGLTHGIGFLLAIAGLVLLLISASLYGTAKHIVGFAIFGSGLTALYFVSSVYHFIPTHRERVKKLFQTFDHAMIYVLIASTYTPLTLTLPARGWGWSLFGIIWGLAGIGIVTKLARMRMKPWVPPLLYIAMGWLIVIALPILLKSFSKPGMWWLSLGGVLYTLGVVFFALERVYPRTKLFSFHNVFHIFVMGGSFSHFWFMFQYVLYV